MFSNAALVLASLIVLALGAELLVRGATALARRARVSPFFVGVTIVGFGTSTPELFTSVLSGARGQQGIALGNVVGSNIFNIAVILGLTAVIRPIAIVTTDVAKQLRVVILVAAVPFVALAAGGLDRTAGVLMLVGLAVYIWSAYRDASRGAVHGNSPGVGNPGATTPRTLGATWSVALIVVGLGALVGGSSLFVQSAREVAAGLGVSELAIGLTVVAAGTSTPELFTSLVAAVRGQTEVAVANVFGSNVFNILGVLGATCVFEPQAVSSQVLVFDAPVMMLTSLAMVPILFSGGRISRAEGIVLCVGYAAYVTVLFSWAPGWFRPS